MRIVFMGSGAFGLPTLEVLGAAHEVTLVVTQPDRPAGRKRQLTPTPIGGFASNSGINTIKPDDVNADETVSTVERAQPDAIVVIAFGQKIGPRIIDAPRHGARGTMNLHGSVLPKFRGAAPINWAIIRGESQTGLTMINLVDRMDAGDMLGTRATAIDPHETAGELHDRLATMGPELTLDVLEQLADGRLRPEPQDESEATVAPKLTKADGTVDFREAAATVRQVVHGLTPWPGVTVGIRSTDTGAPQSLLLRRVEPVMGSEHGAEPGTMVEPGVVAVGHGESIRIVEAQPPGKRPMSWNDFARGHAVPIGCRFDSPAR